MSDKNFPVQSPDSSKPIIQATTLKGDTGDPGRTFFAGSPFIGIPCDANNDNPVYTNAMTIFYVVEGSEIIGEEGAQNGWSLSSPSQSNCTIQINNFTITVTAILADTAYFTVRAFKVGESPLYCIVFVKRMHKGPQGAQGDQGTTGNTGATGAQGPAGSDGTGLVMLKFDVPVVQPQRGTPSNVGGFTRLTFGSDHGFVEGQRLHLFNDASWDEFGSVTSVVSNLIVDTDIYFVAAEGAMDVRDMRKFIRQDTYGWYDDEGASQILEFPNILPIGARLEEVALVYKTRGSSGYIWFDVGYYPYPTAGYYAYLGNRPLSVEGAVEQAQVGDPTHSAYNVKMITADNYRRDLYVRGRPHNTSINWDIVMAADVWEFIIAYKNFPTSYTP